LRTRSLLGWIYPSLTKSFSRITANLEDYSAQVRGLKAAGDYRYSQLVQLKTTVEGEAASLGKVSKGLTEEIRRLGDARQQWLAEQKQWKEWQSALLKDEPLTEVKSTFVQAQKNIDKALNLILQKLKPMLAVQKKVGNIQAKIETVGADIDGLISALRGGVLVESSPPMFSSKYFSQFSSELWYRTQKGLGPEYPLESALVRLRRGNSSEGLVRECARLGTRQPSFEMAAGTLARLGRVSLSATRCGDIIGGDQPKRKGVGGRAETAALYTPGG